MILNDIPHLTFTVHPDGSVDRTPVTGKDIRLERRLMRVTDAPGDFNPMATLFAGIPIFGPAQILPEVSLPS